MRVNGGAKHAALDALQRLPRMELAEEVGCAEDVAGLSVGELWRTLLLPLHVNDRVWGGVTQGWVTFEWGGIEQDD